MHPARAAFSRRGLWETQGFNFSQGKTLQMKQSNCRRKQERQKSVHLAGAKESTFPASLVLRQETTRIERNQGTDGKQGGAQMDGAAQAGGSELRAQMCPLAHETEQAGRQGVRQFARQR